MTSMQRLLKTFLLGSALAGLAVLPAGAALSPQIPIAGSAIPQFVQPLPTLATTGGTIATLYGNTSLNVKMCEFQSYALPPGTFPAALQPATWVWGYLVDPDPAGMTSCADLVDLNFDGAIDGNTGPLDTYLGPVIVSDRGQGSTDITWINELGSADTTNVLAYKYSIDKTLHWADPMMEDCMMGGIPEFGSSCADNYYGPVAAVPHLHGGEVPPEIDGSPDSWFTSDGTAQGHKYYTFGAPAGNRAIYKYPNQQEAGPLWFHDHTLGATRLNVFAGLAGAYYLRDSALQTPPTLQPLEQVVPIIIQDRMFDTNGQLFYQTASAGGVLWATNPDHPYWTPEFVGDTILVNGKAWPYFNVEPRRYRFLFLNGSNARAYEMFLTNPVTKANGPALWVIGTDGGYLDAPMKIDPVLKQKLVMQPGERYEVIIDFKGFAGTTLHLRNVAKTPYPGGVSPQGATTGRIMQFNVAAGAVADASYNPASGEPLRKSATTSGDQRIVRLANPATGALAAGVTVNKTRQLTLNEVMGMPVTAIDPVTGVLTAYPGGPLEILVNNTKWSGEYMGETRPDFTPVTVGGVTTSISEIPREGDTEIWEVVNLTADAHPMHLHLVQFQILNRQNFNVGAYTAAYDLAFPAVMNDPMCTGGVYCPGFGPPLDYFTGNPRALGGNPDVQPFLQGPVRPPLAWEAGWKDTAIMYPGQVTRIAVRWAPTDLPVATAASGRHFPFDPSGADGYNYVWHCHIIDHEDNEMMRPDTVRLNPLAPEPALRDLVKGVDY